MTTADDEQPPFEVTGRGYWRTVGAIRWVDGRETRWTETVLGHDTHDPTAQLVGLSVEETPAP